MAPDYADTTMWVRAMGDTAGTGADIFYVVSTWEVDWTTDDSLPCHYADVYNPLHQEHMHIEQEKVAAYMGIENNFYAPLYRHTTIEAFTSRDEQLISERYGAVSWQDVQTAFIVIRTAPSCWPDSARGDYLSSNSFDIWTTRPISRWWLPM